MEQIQYPNEQEKRIGEFLIRMNILSPEQVKSVLRHGAVKSGSRNVAEYAGDYDNSSIKSRISLN